MRRASRGGLDASKSRNLKPHGAESSDHSVQEEKTPFATKPTSRHLKTKRANEQAAPTHKARTTKVYSVSLPV